MQWSNWVHSWHNHIEKKEKRKKKVHSIETKFDTNDIIMMGNPNEKNKNEWFERLAPTWKIYYSKMKVCNTRI